MKHTLISLFSIFTFIPLNASDAVQAPKLAAGMTLTICQHDSVQLEKLLIQSDSELTNLRIKRNNLAQYTYSPEGNTATLSYTHIVKNGHSLTTTYSLQFSTKEHAQVTKVEIAVSSENDKTFCQGTFPENTVLTITFPHPAVNLP